MNQHLIPQTDLHKLAGFFGGLIVSAGAYYGINVPIEVAIILFNGVWLLLSTVIGKHTNPTGANASTARQALEIQTGTGTTSEFPAPAARKNPAGSDPDQDATGVL